MSKLELTFLGMFSVSLDGAPVAIFESNKVRALLAYLAVEAQRPHSREALAALLWPDWPDSAARSNLRYALADLRKVIGDQRTDPPFLLITRDTIQFNTGSDHWLDVVEFGGLGNPPGGDHLERLCQALALYKGDFLDGFSVAEAAPFEEWVRLKREQLHRQHLRVLGEVAAVYERGGDIPQALAYAWRQVEIEPWQEAAQRQLMRLLALDGQRSAALAQYDACRRTLAIELRAEPSLETIALYESIRDGTLEAQVGAASRLEELPPAPGVPPFMGMQYFDEHDADLYFGRETLTARLVGRLAEPGGARFLAVVGASGSGKSSLVRAGLVPAIRKGERLADGSMPPRWSHRWLVHVITPTAHPLEALATSLTREGGPVSTTASLIDDLAKDPRSLHLYARRMTHIRNAPHLLLVVDQFEELFTLCRSESERSAFVENLLLAAGVETPASEEEAEGALNEQSGRDGPVIGDQPGPVVAVIALRADFYSHCAQYARLRSALSARQEYIGPMSPDELRRAIEEPARLNDWEFEPGLVDLILREVSDEPGGLPLLSHALLETWRRRRGRALTLKGYAEAGGIHRAIAQTAESVYTNLSPENRDLARRIFLRLTELGEGTQDTRRRVSLSELVPSPEAATQIESVLNTLVEARLVTAGEGTVEVAHEALIREWPALRQWLDENRESLRLHRHLTEAAQAWQAMGRDPGELYRGARLAQAVEWFKQPDNAEALNAQERDFLAASEKLEVQILAEQKAQQRRELEAAQRAAEAERLRAEEQAHSVFRLRRRAVYLVGVVLVALVMAGAALAFANRSANLAVQNAESARYASTQQAIAEAETHGRATQQAIAEAEAVTRAAAEGSALQQAELARARELSLAAINNLPLDPELSILLALEAVSITQSSGLPVPIEVESSLHRSVQASRALLTTPSEDPPPWQLAYSPDGSLLAVSLDNDTISLRDASSGEERLRIFGGGGDVAFNPEGDWVVGYIYSDNEDDRYKAGAVTIFNAGSGEILLGLGGVNFTVNGHDAPIESAAFSPDGTHLATGSDDFTARIWDIAFLADQEPTDQDVVIIRDQGLEYQGLNEEEYILTGHSGAVNGVAYSPDGLNLATASSDGTIKLWDTRSGQELRTLRGHQSDVTDVAFSPDGRIAASASADGTARLWDAATGEIIKVLEGHTSIVLAVAFSPDGARLATASQDGTARVWDVASGEWLYTLAGQRGAVNDIAYSPDGEHLATTDRERIRVWDASDGGLGELAVLPWGCEITSSNLSQDGTLFIQGCEDGHVILRDATSLQELSTFEPTVQFGALAGVALSPDMSRLAAAQGPTIRVWDLASDQVLLSLSVPTGDVGSLAFSPDGGLLAAGIGESDILIWDAASGKEQYSLSSHADKWEKWSYRLLSGNPIFPADTQTGRPGKVVGLVYSPDGAHLASIDTQVGIARVWEMPGGGLLHDELGGYFKAYQSAVFSPDGGRLATVSLGNVTEVWDVANGKGIWSMPASVPEGLYTTGTRRLWYHQRLLGASEDAGKIQSAAFSPDGKFLAAALPEGTLRVWDANSGTEAFSFSGPRFIGAYFTPDGGHLVGFSADGKFRVFTLRLEELVELARSRLTRGWRPEECQKYLHLEACPTTP